MTHATIQTQLREGLHSRAPVMDDLADFVAMANASARDTTGHDEYSVAESRVDWELPSFNIDTDARIVATIGGRIVGGVEVWSQEPFVRYWLWGRIHPKYLDQGIGSYLMEWAEARARQLMPKAPSGTRVVAYAGIVSGHDPARALLEEHDFRLVRHFLTMAIDMDQPPPQPAWPENITLRTMVVDQDEEALYRTTDEAFRDHWGHVERPFEEGFERMMHWLKNREDFDPSLCFLAVDGREIAGVSLCRPKTTEFSDMGWVDTLGVRRLWRRRGLALALLQHTFGEFYRRGPRRAGLGVDATSLTGATRLYEKAGMRPIRQYDSYEKELRPGRDLSTQSVET
jgi:mycothiol synthase